MPAAHGLHPLHTPLFPDLFVAVQFWSTFFLGHPLTFPTWCWSSSSGWYQAMHMSSGSGPAQMSCWPHLSSGSGCQSSLPFCVALERIPDVIQLLHLFQNVCKKIFIPARALQLGLRGPSPPWARKSKSPFLSQAVAVCLAAQVS